MTKANTSISKRVFGRLEFLAETVGEPAADFEAVCRSITKALLQPEADAKPATYWACIAVRCAQALAIKFPGKKLFVAMRGSKLLHKAWQSAETPADFIGGFRIDAAKVGLQEAINPENLPERILAMAFQNGGSATLDALFQDT